MGSIITPGLLILTRNPSVRILISIRVERNPAEQATMKIAYLGIGILYVRDPSNQKIEVSDENDIRDPHIP
ncbi:hypothetical protein HN588_04290 [Candidatus Bathyarchaeota archaeon]|nr:hypothetical protein [Candidatus Bathyarchaeota archaeon]